MGRFIGLARGMLLGSVASLAVSAHAQEAAPEATTIEDIVVTAQRRSEGLQKVPISVNAFTQEAMANLNLRSTDQLQMATPGFVNTQTAGDGISGTYIRGVGSGYSGPGLEGSIAYYLDDVYLQTQTSVTQNAVDIAQIEVLKGPQGTLYGRNATGGAVVVTTADPRLDSFEGYAKIGYGNLDWKRGEGVLNVPLASNLAVRVAGFYEERDGYVKNVAFPEQRRSGTGAGYTWQGRVKLLWEPDDSFRTVLTASWDRRNGHGAIHSLRYGSNGQPTDLGWYETSQSLNREGGGGDDTKAKMFSWRTEYQDGIWNFSNTLAYRETRAFGCTDNDGLPAELLYFCTVSQRSPNPGNSDGKEDNTLTNEFRVVSTSDGPLDVTMGAYLQRNRARFVGRIGGAFFGDLTPTFDNRDNLDAWSVYGELYYNVTERIRLTGGLRYTKENKTHTVHLDGDALAFTGGFLPAFAEQETSFSNVSPRFVVSYDADTVNYYASFAQGFKSGGFNSPGFGADPPLKPETIDAFEIGAKFRSPDGSLRISGALFHYDWHNVQVAFITGGGAGIQQQNAAAARSRGGEVNVDWQPCPAVTLNLGAAYTDGNFTSFPSAAVYNIINGFLGATAADLSGTPLPSAPDFTGNASVTWNVDIGDWKARMSAAGRYTTKYDYTAGAGGQLQASRQKAFGLVNLSGAATAPGDHVELGFFVSNLFDVQHISLVSTGDTGVYQTPAEPRTFGGTVKYSF